MQLPGPAQLAWLGDAVWELHQRSRLVRYQASAHQLHRAGVDHVRAEAQSAALAFLEPHLNAAELDWVRKGRNAAGRGPRRAIRTAEGPPWAFSFGSIWTGSHGAGGRENLAQTDSYRAIKG